MARSGLCLAALAATLLGAAGCKPIEPGEAGVTAELNRLEGKNGFAVISSAPERTIFAAKGRQVVIAPADGFCVAQDSLDVSGNAAFVLLSDCAANTDGARTFPGILTVSVSGAPMVETGSTADAAIDGLVGFLAGDAGSGLLGRGGSGGAVSVEEMRRVGDGLYVLVEDTSGAPLPVLDGRFWRAFVDLGGRMTMVTVSGFRGAPVGEDQMLAFLVQQVVALKRANNAPPTADELQMAGRLDEAYSIATSGAARSVAVEIEPYVPGDAPETPAVGQGVASVPGQTLPVVPAEAPNDRSP